MDGYECKCAKVYLNILLTGSSSRGRALDIGCAVGGTSFELTTYFNEVVGIDYSNHFVDAANMMKERGEAEIDILKQGTIFTKANVKVSDRLDRRKASFYQGDACNLDPQLGLSIYQFNHLDFNFSCTL